MTCAEKDCELPPRSRSRFCSEKCYQRDYAFRNAEKRRLDTARWRRENRDRNLAYNRQYNQDNPALFAGIRARRRSAAGEGVTNEQWNLILEAADNRCCYCGAGGKMTMDHVVPLSRGGLHDTTNVVPACHSCNSSKCAKFVEDWMPDWIRPPWCTLVPEAFGKDRTPN